MTISTDREDLVTGVLFILVVAALGAWRGPWLWHEVMEPWRRLGSADGPIALVLFPVVLIVFVFGLFLLGTLALGAGNVLWFLIRGAVVGIFLLVELLGSTNLVPNRIAREKAPTVAHRPSSARSVAQDQEHRRPTQDAQQRWAEDFTPPRQPVAGQTPAPGFFQRIGEGLLVNAVWFGGAALAAVVSAFMARSC